MKKAVNFFITALLAICMIFPLAACGEKEKAEELPIKRIIKRTFQAQIEINTMTTNFYVRDQIETMVREMSVLFWNSWHTFAGVNIVQYRFGFCNGPSCPSCLQDMLE